MSIYQSIPLEQFDGTVGNRFNRDYENMATTDTAGIADARKGRQLDEQSIERQGRLYVDPVTLVSETGQNAGLDVNAYGTTNVTTDRYTRPVGAAETNDGAITAGLVPPVGAFIDSDGDGVMDSEDYAPNDPDVTEAPVEPTPEPTP